MQCLEKPLSQVLLEPGRPYPVLAPVDLTSLGAQMVAIWHVIDMEIGGIILHSIGGSSLALDASGLLEDVDHLTWASG